MVRPTHATRARIALAVASIAVAGCSAGPTSSAQTSSATASPTRAGSGRIVYQGDGLTIVGADGADKHPLLVDGSISGNHPDWSPDGRSIAFEVEEQTDGTGDLWVVRTDGTQPRRIFDCSRPCQLAQSPAWSPDGTRIAYSWSEFPPSVTQEIRVLDMATGRDVETFTFPPFVGVTDPRWSPDGTRIAYTVQRFAGPGDDPHLVDGAVGVLDVSGAPTNGHAITPWRILGSYPAWSPGGDRIIFQAGDETPFDLTDPGSSGHTSDLWIVRPDGSGLRQLTHQRPSDPRLFGPDWGGGPHPIRVAILASNGSSLVLGMLDPDGTHLQPILDGSSGQPLDGAHPRWTSAGS